MPAAAGKPRTRPSPFGRVDLYLAYCASILLALMMAFIFLGAVLRYAFNAPFQGGNEVVELISVGVVMLGVPYCTTRDGHVRIDLLDPVLGRLGRAIADLLYRAIGVTVLGFLVWAYVDRTLDALEFGDQTNMLGIPVWPFYVMIVVGMGAYALILILQQLRQFAQLGSRNE